MNPAVGDKLTLSISDIAFGGEGVARFGDFVIFVPFVARGEVAEARTAAVSKTSRSMAPTKGRIEMNPSPYGNCARCGWSSTQPRSVRCV